jgi:hypothetical protein
MFNFKTKKYSNGFILSILKMAFMRNGKKLLLLFIIFTYLLSCSKGYHPFVSKYQFHSADGKPDYGNLDYWAANPYKKNLSDSLPDALQKGFRTDSSVDVFFIHPTTYTDSTFPFGLNAPVDNAELNAKTDYTTILNQASIFNGAGRVFAPRYRQANYWCYFPKDSAAALKAFQLAYEDVKTAFEYYLKHYNNGRPIIIAAHSQGTTHAKWLLKEFFDEKPLQKQLVAAYLVGMPIEPDYFSEIRSCDSASQTGCFCSWRTMKTGYVTDFAQHEKFTAVVTNPLTWSKSMPSATRDDNPGSVLLKFNKISPHVTDAIIHQGVLWCDKPRFFGSIFLKTKNYHIADYNLFYLSVRENAKLRAKTFLKK